MTGHHRASFGEVADLPLIARPVPSPSAKPVPWDPAQPYRWARFSAASTPKHRRPATRSRSSVGRPSDETGAPPRVRGRIAALAVRHSAPWCSRSREKVIRASSLASSNSCRRRSS